MKEFGRNLLALVIGLMIGSAVNMGVIMIGGKLIPPPEGVDVTNMESLADSMHLFKPVNFITPFLAHALGTLVGAFVASKIAIAHNMKISLLVGVFFLVGGFYTAQQLPTPDWFNGLDLLLAYIPMAWLGGKWAEGSLRA